MKTTAIKILTAGVLALSLGLGSGSGPSLAGPADDAIKARQGCMKAIGSGSSGAISVFAPIFKAEKPYDAAVVAAAVAAMEAACDGWAGWWGADTMIGESLETWATPEVWSDASGFKEAGGAKYPALQALKASTDEAGFKAAYVDFGGTCKGCHDTFRRPKE